MTTRLEDSVRRTLQAAAAATPNLAPPPMTRLVSDSPQRNHRWPRLISIGAAAGTVVAAMAVATGGASPAAADVTFTRSGSDLIATFDDPQASSASLHEAFKRRNLDISLTLLPVSPSLVGTLVYSDTDRITPFRAGTCQTGGGSCPVGIRIPSDFTGPAHVAVGRQAEANEGYASTAVSSLASGEALHCSSLLGKHVSEIAPALAARGLRAYWRTWHTDDHGNRVGDWATSAPTDTLIVHSIQPRSRDSVYVTANADPYTAEYETGIVNFQQYNARLNAGC